MTDKYSSNSDDPIPGMVCPRLACRRRSPYSNVLGVYLRTGDPGQVWFRCNHCGNESTRTGLMARWLILHPGVRLLEHSDARLWASVTDPDYSWPTATALMTEWAAGS